MICLVLTIFANIFPSAWTGLNERTFLAIKPDGFQRRLVGEIIRRFEKKGFKLVGLKLVQERHSRQRLGGERAARDRPVVPSGRAAVLGGRRRALAVRVGGPARASSGPGPRPAPASPLTRDALWELGMGRCPRGSGGPTRAGGVSGSAQRVCPSAGRAGCSGLSLSATPHRHALRPACPLPLGRGSFSPFPWAGCLQHKRSATAF
ncbi:nucleoside diphosphate kinase 3 isoform X1 [Notamacropus eugenii]|uniref:nucleoside diphosphate kinase 3 isoform X1 n=1 Tax=Notamacropus eugenii TaxID=9315 RepID=UPI003B66DC40